jgi:hypothetical protein
MEVKGESARAEANRYKKSTFVGKDVIDKKN